MWLNLVGMAVKTGAEVYKNKKQSEALESQAKKLHYEKMARGEIEYTGKILDSQKGDYKDEFVLMLISVPIILLFWSVFSDDPKIQEKVALFFEHFNNLPFWFQALWVSVCGAIFGIKATDLIKRK
jgi:uncharacterized membrane protein